MKITLSEEALEKLGELRQGGAFRSDSATIEECIRVVKDLISDFQFEIGSYMKNNPGKGIPQELQLELLRRIILRLSRFDQTVDSKIRKAGT